MFNLIKMDTYRLIHSRSTWIILIFVIALAIFSAVMTDSDIELMKSDPVNAVTEEESGRQIGIAVWPDPEWMTGKIEVGRLISSEIKSGLLSILCVIFAAMFANAEQKNGYIKNIIGQFPGRGVLIISKFTAIAIQVFFMIVVFSLVTAATGFILWGSDLYMGSVLSLCKFLGVQYLLHLGFALLIMFLSILTRSTAFSMTAGILICAGLEVPICSAVNKMVYDINPVWEFDINNYLLDGNITMTGISASSDEMMRSVLVGVAFAFAAVILAITVIKRRDVR